jgi:hypothetical protein
MEGLDDKGKAKLRAAFAAVDEYVQVGRLFATLLREL